MNFSDKELDQQIDQLRKGNFSVTILNSNENLFNGKVKYKLVRHAFGFGTAVAANYLLANPNINNDARQYQEIVKKYFNCAVAENAHKWYSMEKTQGVLYDDEALQVWKRCREFNIPMRGHCIFWGIEQFVQQWIKQLSPVELEEAMQKRLQHILVLFKGKITEWDLNNEMMHGDYYAQKLGWKNGATYFKWAKKIAPENSFFVNDYDVLQGNSVDTYIAHIKELQAEGAEIGGIGDQAHFTNAVPPSPQVWNILNKLGSFHLPVKITEFDIKTKDEIRQAEDTRRFYRLCFAHPAVHAILMWGFWEGSHWIPEAALWRRDWSIKPNGSAYLELMKEWHTEGIATLDKKGRFNFRGFYGEYEIIHNKQIWQVTFDKTKTSATIVSSSQNI